MKQEKIYIYGKHALVEALTNSPKSVTKVFLEKDTDKELMKLITKHGISVSKINKNESGNYADKNGSHQGVIASVSLGNLLKSYDSFMDNLKVSDNSCILVMNELQDPHNVGAVIRSAGAMGVSAVFVPEHNQAPITGTVVKVSAGMAFSVPIVKIGNVNNVIRDLKKKGFWVYGLEGESKHSIVTEKFEGPTVFVLGNESKGIREKTKELCDVLLSIPMHPRCESMNVASSTAIALYAWSIKHPNSLNTN